MEAADHQLSVRDIPEQLHALRWRKLLLASGPLLLVIEEADEVVLLAELERIDGLLEILLDLLVQRLHVIQCPLLLELLVGDGEHLGVLLGASTVRQLHPVQYRDLREHAARLRDHVQEQLAFRNGQEDLDLATREDVDLVRNLALFEYFLVFVKHVDAQADRHLVEDVLREVEHELNILEHLSLPLPVDIVVREEVLLQGGPDLGEHEDHFFELLLLEEADHRVDLRTDARRSRLASEQADFPEEVAAFQRSDEDVTARMRIFDVDFTLA